MDSKTYLCKMRTRENGVVKLRKEEEKEGGKDYV